MSEQIDQGKMLDWNRIAQETGPYPTEAFHFVREGLTYTVFRVHQDPEALVEEARHISGQQLCLGLREYAIERYGLLAPIVLDQWHIRRTDDFGRIVFAMINAGLLSKNPDDALDDFRGVYDFTEAFSRDELVSRIGNNESRPIPEISSQSGV